MLISELTYPLIWRWMGDWKTGETLHLPYAPIFGDF